MPGCNVSVEVPRWSPKLKRIWLIILVAGLCIPALQAEPVEGIVFEDVWIRAMPPFQPNSAGYMTISNNRETAIAVVGASSNVSKKTEIHTTRQVDGLMRMEQLDGVALAPGERLELAPGGTHLMLLGLEYRPVAGDDIELCLHLVTEEIICTPAEVRKSASSSAGGHEHH